MIFGFGEPQNRYIQQNMTRKKKKICAVHNVRESKMKEIYIMCLV